MQIANQQPEQDEAVADCLAYDACVRGRYVMPACSRGKKPGFQITVVRCKSAGVRCLNASTGFAKQKGGLD